MASQIDNRAPPGSLIKKPRLEKPHKPIRSERELDDAHLKNIRQLPCLICGETPSDAAHVRYSSPVHGKRNTPMGQKPSDKWALPLCRKHHDEQHRTGELTFWNRANISPFLVCVKLYEKRGDIISMRRIVAMARLDSASGDR